MLSLLPMHQDRSPDRRAALGGRLLFALSLWISLATAIVCAVVPAGLPLTRTTGSAFDPSTTIVALRSRPPATIKATVPRSGEGDDVLGGAGPAALPAPAPIAAGPGVAAAPDPAIGLLRFAPAPHAIPAALYARPPPAA